MRHPFDRFGFKERHLARVSKVTDYKNGCPILENEVLKDDEYICPICGLVCSSLTEYHRHYGKKHEKKTDAVE